MEKEVEEEAERKKRNECSCQPDLAIDLRSHSRALYFREFAKVRVSAAN